MSATFDCPSCGASLDIGDGGKATIECQYCGKTVIVPHELRAEQPESRTLGHSGQDLLEDTMQQAARLAEVAELVRNGEKIEAIKLYRQITGLGLKESKDAVEQYQRGGELVFNSISVEQGEFVAAGGEVDKEALLARTRELLSQNQKIEAIKVFRTAYDVGLKESKEVVDELESGARTSLDGYFPRANAPKAADSEPLTMRTGRPVPGWVWWLLVVGILACMILPFFISTLATIAPIAIMLQSMGFKDLIATPLAEQFDQPQGIQLPNEAPGVGATPFVLEVSGPARVVFSFGGEGSGPGLFNDARSVAVDRNSGMIYVAEYQGGRVQAFDASGKFLTQWNLGNRDAIITGMAAGRDGQVYIASGGDILRYEGATGALIGPLQIEGNNDYLESVAMRASGELVVIGDSEDILWLDTTGKLAQALPEAISSVSGDAELDARLAVDGLDFVYALGRFNNAVFKFAPDGKYVNRFGSDGDEPGQFRAPYAIAADNQSRVFVSDIHGIQIFDSTGRYLDTIEPRQGVVFGMTFNDQNELYTVSNDQKVTKYTLTIGE